MPTDLDELAAKVAELLDVAPRKQQRKDRRPRVVFRATNDELALIDAAAVAHGVCRSDLIRLGLNSVMQTVMPLNRQSPAGLKRFTVRHKPDRFSDEKTSVPLRDASAVRHLAARALGANIERHMAIAEAGGALALRPHNAQEGMGDSPSPLLSGKLSR